MGQDIKGEASSLITALQSFLDWEARHSSVSYLGTHTSEITYFPSLLSLSFSYFHLCASIVMLLEVCVNIRVLNCNVFITISTHESL